MFFPSVSKVALAVPFLPSRPKQTETACCHLLTLEVKGCHPTPLPSARPPYEASGAMLERKNTLSFLAQ